VTRPNLCLYQICESGWGAVRSWTYGRPVLLIAHRNLNSIMKVQSIQAAQQDYRIHKADVVCFRSYYRLHCASQQRLLRQNR